MPRQHNVTVYFPLPWSTEGPTTQSLLRNIDITTLSRECRIIVVRPGTAFCSSGGGFSQGEIGGNVSCGASPQTPITPCAAGGCGTGSVPSLDPSFGGSCGAGSGSGNDDDQGPPSCQGGTYPYRGVCVECPKMSQSWGNVGILISVAVAFVVFKLAVITYVVKTTGGSLANALFRTRDYLFWTVLSWQNLSMVGRAMPNSAPSAVLWITDRITIFELDADAVAHPACLGSNPFAWRLVMFSAYLCIVVGVVAAFALRPSNVVAICRRMGLAGLTLLHGFVSSQTMSVLNCVSSNGDLVLSENHLVKCWQGKHRDVGVLAVFVLPLSVIFPILTAVALLRRLAGSAQAILSGSWSYNPDDHPHHFRSSWKSFLQGDYTPHWLFIRSVNLSTLTILALVLPFAQRQPPVDSSVHALLFSLTIMVLIPMPFLMTRPGALRPTKSWKVIPRVLVSVTAGFTALCTLLYHWKGDKDTSDALAYISMMSVLVLWVVFNVTFYRALMQGGRRDAAGLPFDEFSGSEGESKPTKWAENPLSKTNTKNILFDEPGDSEGALKSIKSTEWRENPLSQRRLDIKKMYASPKVSRLPHQRRTPKTMDDGRRRFSVMTTRDARSRTVGAGKG